MTNDTYTDGYAGWQERAIEAGHCTSECPAQYHTHGDEVIAPYLRGLCLECPHCAEKVAAAKADWRKRERI